MRERKEKEKQQICRPGLHVPDLVSRLVQVQDLQVQVQVQVQVQNLQVQVQV